MTKAKTATKKLDKKSRPTAADLTGGTAALGDDHAEDTADSTPKRKLLLRITEDLWQKLSLEAVKKEWSVPHVAIRILESEVGRKHNRKG